MVIVFLPESTRLNDVMPRPQAKAPKALTPLLEIRNLTKSFDGPPAVADVSLTIYKGEIFALLGRLCSTAWIWRACRPISGLLI